jgi:hypothetical protein
VSNQQNLCCSRAGLVVAFLTGLDAPLTQAAGANGGYTHKVTTHSCWRGAALNFANSLLSMSYQPKG